MSKAAILAGGRASRFGGRDKGALIVDGRTILDRQIATLARVTAVDEILLVGGATVHPSTRPIADRVLDSGPLGGIHAALWTISIGSIGSPESTRSTGSTGPTGPGGHHDAVFVLACDMPYVSASLIDHLLGLAQTADIVVPRTERGYHPLCAVYTRACLHPIARRLAARQLKTIDVFDEVRVRVVESEELERFGDRHRLLANVNTPADYAGLGALQGHQL